MNNPYIEIKNIKQLCEFLGLPKAHASRIEVCRDLIIAIRNKILSKKWTHLQATERAAVGRTVITAIMNGDISKISTDRLLEIAGLLGLNIKMKVT